MLLQSSASTENNNACSLGTPRRLPSRWEYHWAKVKFIQANLYKKLVNVMLHSNTEQKPCYAIKICFIGLGLVLNIMEHIRYIMDE